LLNGNRVIEVMKAPLVMVVTAILAMLQIDGSNPD
jgi:hypothetical protein